MNIFTAPCTAYSSHLIVVVVGFVDTLVDVDETDGQATLNVSISSPQPILGFRPLQTMFSLRVDSVDGSAGRDGTPNVVIFINMSVSVTYNLSHIFNLRLCSA